MRLSVKELGARHFYDFSSELQYTNNAFVDETEGNAYNLDKYPTFIDMVKKQYNRRFLCCKISPLFMNKQVKNLKNENEEKKVLTFENTSWKENDQQNILANYLATSKGNTLFREANKYILDNLGFKLTDLNSIVLELFKVEGLI